MSKTIILPIEIKKILDLISIQGKEAYLVGGAVRDAIIGRENTDYDLCTNMSLEAIKEIFPNFTIMKENPHRNTGVMKIGNEEIEISSFHGNSLIEDLSNRDFTINALAVTKEGKIIDPYNGEDSIKRKEISLVKPGGEALKADPLRILRAIRLSASLDFTIEENTKKQLQNSKELLADIPPERIYSEVIKILMTPKPAKYIRENKDIFFQIIPELKETEGFKQNNPYHIYDIFEHTMQVLEKTRQNLPLRLAALFHDIGKPLTYSVDDNGIGHFYMHSKESVKIFSNVSKRLKIDKKTENCTIKLIENHDKALSTKKVKINKFIQEFGTEDLELLFDLKRADVKAQSPRYLTRLQEIDDLEEKYLETAKSNPCLTVKDLNINGKKLIEMGFVGKEIGFVLNSVLNEVISDNLKNNESQIETYIGKHYK